MFSNDDAVTIEYAEKILSLARETIMVRYRFFDAALSRIRQVPEMGTKRYSFDGDNLIYDPKLLLKDYVRESNFAVRLLLHVIFHGLFLHRTDLIERNEEYWNFACDIAVENLILKLEDSEIGLLKDAEARTRLAKLSKWIPSMTAPKIYREFAVNGISKEAEEDYRRLFAMDYHPEKKTQNTEEDIFITEEMWRRLAEKVRTEIKDFNDDKAVPEELLENLKTATKPKTDYAAMLSRFATLREEIKVNPDEFDYVYYTYGLRLYDNMPLIEPLEYTENHRIRDFVIAIDTSASCNGKTVRQFLTKTYEILKTTESFFSKINLHIIQCDAKVREDAVIKSGEELEKYLDSVTVKGFGATDFRPVFSYVEELLAKNEFEDLKGLIYFTDGYGVYPSGPPGYDVMYVFIGEDEMRPRVPAWAVNFVLEEDSM